MSKRTTDDKKDRQPLEKRATNDKQPSQVTQPPQGRETNAIVTESALDSPSGDKKKKPLDKKSKSTDKKLDDVAPSDRKSIFGNPLKDEIARSQLRFGPQLIVPDFLYFSTKYLESLGLNQVGLFRIAGDKKDCTLLKERLYDGFEISLQGEAEHTVCTLIKQYLRSLPVPLCTFEYFDEFLYLSKIKGEDNQVEHLLEYLNAIPSENAIVLNFLITFMKKVTANATKNQMNESNIASMIAPNILFRESENLNKVLSDTKDSNYCVEFMMKKQSQLFAEFEQQKDLGTIVDLYKQPKSPSSPPSELKKSKGDLKKSSTSAKEAQTIQSSSSSPSLQKDQEKKKEERKKDKVERVDSNEKDNQNKHPVEPLPTKESQRDSSKEKKSDTNAKEEKKDTSPPDKNEKSERSVKSPRRQASRNKDPQDQIKEKVIKEAKPTNQHPELEPMIANPITSQTEITEQLHQMNREVNQPMDTPSPSQVVSQEKEKEIPKKNEEGPNPLQPQIKDDQIQKPTETETKQTPVLKQPIQKPVEKPAEPKQDQSMSIQFDPSNPNSLSAEQTQIPSLPLHQTQQSSQQSSQQPPQLSKTQAISHPASTIQSATSPRTTLPPQTQPPQLPKTQPTTAHTQPPHIQPHTQPPLTPKGQANAPVKTQSTPRSIHAVTPHSPQILNSPFYQADLQLQHTQTAQSSMELHSEEAISRDKFNQIRAMFNK